MEFAEDLFYLVGNSDKSDEESSDKFMDNLLIFLSDDKSDRVPSCSFPMECYLKHILPFCDQVDVETDASHSTPLYENASLSCGKLASNNGFFTS